MLFRSLGSDLILSKDGRCGFFLGGLLFFILSDGISMKAISEMDFMDASSLALQKAEGNDISSVEINKQEYLDAIEATVLGSGKVDYQRLSGYITPQGVVKIFFYDGNSKLKGMESSDRRTWIVSDNF